jgi:ribonuclease G
LPWFRFRRKREQDEQDATAPSGAVEEGPRGQADPAPHEVPAGEAAATEDAETKRKRRRGTRGGRGRKKPAAETTAETRTAAGEPAKGQAAKRREQEREKEADRGGDRERRSRSGQRRRQIQRRAPLPAAKRELLISVDVGEQRVAVVEDDQVAEVYLERPERRSIAGNIYLGVVDNVLPGMEAAFVEIGLEKNGFLYVDEIVVPELEGKRHGRKIQDLISRGQQILVQAVKDPMKTKGARLTTEISLPGRFLVYVPNGEGLGVSRRLDDTERQRLKDIIKNLDPKQGGIIVRTAAEGASAEDIERDLVFLLRLWKTIQARAKGAKAPELVYQEAELPLRIVRDLFAGDFVSAQVDNDRAHRRIIGYLKKTSPHMVERVHRYKERTPLFEQFGVDREIESTLSRRVDLPSGGYLVFDYAEAFTVVDVNTGRFVGSRSKSSTQRLEDTITKNNLEAVKEVVRQLRLRDIGGIIVIDFIDMANPKNRTSVEEALRSELERDRTKTYVVEISPLGLVEMTRQNVTDGPREILTRKCPVCEGDGIVVSDHTMAMQAERKLRALVASGSRVQASKIELHPRILSLVVGPGGSRLEAIEEAAKRRFFLVAASDHVHTDHFEVLADGPRSKLQPSSPVEEGAELELKLVEVGLYDPTAGAGRVNGVDVVVGDAAKLVGKKAKVRVGRVLENAAYATLVGVAEPAGPITFESEAEKPTRAPGRRKATAEGAEVADAVVEEVAGAQVEELPEPVVEVRTAVAAAPAGEGEEEAGESRPKRKTRRGSRGGRRRRKTPVPGEAAAGEPAADATAEAVAGAGEGDSPPSEPGGAETDERPRRRRTPKIHLPEAPGAGSGERDEAPVAVREAVAAGGPGEGAGAPEPGAEDGAGEERPAKRTRRGTRGGRRRRKPGAATGTNGGEPPDGDGRPSDERAAGERAGEPEGDDAKPRPRRRAQRPEPAPASPEPESPAPAEPATVGGYVPMSEWLDDFDR